MEEPWLRGPIVDVHPFTAPVLYAFQQAREDLSLHTESLSDTQIWTVAGGGGSVGFHLRHIAGSVDRLMTYVQQHSLSREQLAALERERETHGEDREALLAALDRTFREAETVVRGLDPSILTEVRTVGRKRLPTTVIGLLTHIAEHTQRHVGEAIVTARWIRRGPSS